MSEVAKTIRPVTMLKKLGAKQIMGNVQKAVKDFCSNDGDKVTLYTVFGVANGIKTGSTNYGPWTSFQGSFEAENHVDGQAYASNQAFITEPLQSLLLEALNGSDTVQFAITVEAKRRDELLVGYEFLTTPHIQTQQNDPLAHLREAIPKLAAPVKVAEIENQTEKETVAEVVAEVEAKPHNKGKGHK